MAECIRYRSCHIIMIIGPALRNGKISHPHAIFARQLATLSTYRPQYVTFGLYYAALGHTANLSYLDLQHFIVQSFMRKPNQLSMKSTTVHCMHTEEGQ